jgi:hypothetical protein
LKPAYLLLYMSLAILPQSFKCYLTCKDFSRL